jgi:hypothetical protein
MLEKQKDMYSKTESYKSKRKRRKERDRQMGRYEYKVTVGETEGEDRTEKQKGNPEAVTGNFHLLDDVQARLIVTR